MCLYPVQFAATLQSCAAELEKRKIFPSVILPQARPLSKGEVLGCTSPKIPENTDLIIFLGDGRFHIESAMIQNARVPILRYDPYDKSFTREKYAHVDMRETRKLAINKAISTRKNGNPIWGVLLSTLGRQGNPKILETIEKSAVERNIVLVPILVSEITPAKLSLYDDIEVFIQIGCPRLSIDWGPDTVPKPLLTPYESMIALETIDKPAWFETPSNLNEKYPMDFYSNDSLGPWTNNHESNRPKRRTKKVIKL